MPHLSDMQRSQIVRLKSGKSWEEIINLMSTEFGCKLSKRACQYLMNKFNRTGDVSGLPRPGQPKKLTSRNESE